MSYTFGNPAHAVPLASARQHPENQKENQAGHSSECAVEGPLECGTALGSQPGSRRLAGHQPNRTRLRGQCGSSAGWAATVVAKRQTCWTVYAYVISSEQLNNNDENDENPTRSNSFVTSLSLRSSMIVWFLSHRGSELTKGDARVAGVAPCACFG